MSNVEPREATSALIERNMRVAGSLALSLVALPSLLSAATANYHFTATIQVDDGSPEVIAVSIQPGETKAIEAGQGLRLEFIAPSVTDASGVTVVNLHKRESFGTPAWKHTSRRTGPSSIERTFTIALCGQKFKLISPTPALPFKCGA